MSDRILKKKNRIDFSVILLIVLVILSFLSFVFRVFYNETISRFISYCFFICGYGLCFKRILSFFRFTLVDLISLIFLAYLAFVWLLSGLNRQVIISCMSFFLIYSSFDVVKSLPENNKILKIICIMFFIQSILLIALSFTKYSHMSEISSVVTSSDLLLGLPNPNETAMVIAYTFFGLLTLFRQIKKPIFQYASIIILVFLVYLLIQTRSRTSFVSTLLFVFMYLLNMNRKGLIFKSKFLFLLFILLPLIFVPAYLFLFSHFENIGTFFGKTFFSGRQRVFRMHIDQWTNKIFGNISTFRFDNAHNGFLSIIVNLGICGAFLYLAHLFICLFRLRRVSSTNYVSRMGFIAIMILFLMSCTEAALITSGQCYYSYFLIFCYLANYKKELAK